MFLPENALAKNLYAKKNIASAIMQALNAQRIVNAVIVIMESQTWGWASIQEWKLNAVHDS